MNSVVIRKSYPKILEGRFSSLTCFYEQLVNSRSDVDFFRIISENVVPLIQQSSQFKFLYEKWMKENETYEKEWQAAKSNASKTLEETYCSVYVKLRQKKLLNEPEISLRIVYIESLIHFNSSSKNFRYFQEFSNHLKILFHQILRLGELSIIQPFAEVEKLGEIPFQNAVGYTNKSLILSYVFDPPLEKLSNFEKITSWNRLAKPWAAFNKLLRAERAWNNQKQNFENNSLIEEYVEWKDMEVHKDPTSSENSLFFKREKYLNYVEILLNEILIDQSTSCTIIKNKKISQDDSLPYSIHLVCKSNQLSINIAWLENDNPEEITIHRFYSDSSPYVFFNCLINKKVGEVVNCEMGGGTVSKHISETKLPQSLSKMFIHTMSTYEAKLISNPIILKNISTNDKDRLLKELKKLKIKKAKTCKDKSKQKIISK